MRAITEVLKAKDKFKAINAQSALKRLLPEDFFIKHEMKLKEINNRLDTVFKNLNETDNIKFAHEMAPEVTSMKISLEGYQRDKLTDIDFEDDNLIMLYKEYSAVLKDYKLTLDELKLAFDIFAATLEEEKRKEEAKEERILKMLLCPQILLCMVVIA